jgi:hypothetical protein
MGWTQDVVKGVRAGGACIDSECREVGIGLLPPAGGRTST